MSENKFLVEGTVAQVDQRTSQKGVDFWPVLIECGDVQVPLTVFEKVGIGDVIRVTGSLGNYHRNGYDNLRANRTKMTRVSGSSQKEEEEIDEDVF